MYEESFVIERLVERDREIIRVQGELDIATTPQLESELGEVGGDASSDGLAIVVLLGRLRIALTALRAHCAKLHVGNTDASRGGGI